MPPNDPIATFPTEISVRVFCFLNLGALLCASLVSRRWAAMCECREVWSVMCLSGGEEMADCGTVKCLRPCKAVYLDPSEMRPHLVQTLARELHPNEQSNATGALEMIPGLREGFFTHCRRPKEFYKQMYYITRRLTPTSPSPLPGTPSPYFRNAIITGIAASTTDYHFQSIRETLIESRLSTFWSSVGSLGGDASDDNCRDWLCYQLNGDVCVVRGVEVVASKHEHIHSSLIFAPKEIRFSVGMHCDPRKMHWHSPWYRFECSEYAQFFDFAPDIVVGQYLFVWVHGKFTAHPTDQQYYCALQSVKCLGAALQWHDGDEEMEDRESQVHSSSVSASEVTLTLQRWLLVKEEIGWGEQV